MNKYEAMFILKPKLTDDEKKTIFNQIQDAVSKNNGTVTTASVWAELRKIYFPINKFREALYYLMNFSLPAQAVSEIRHAYKLNENILRVLITKVE